MKKAISVLGYILFILIIFLPLGVILSACFGDIFELSSYSFFALVTALLSVSVVVLCIINKDPIVNKAVTVLFSLSAPLSLINAVLYIVECKTILAFTSMFVCVCCCFYLAAKHGKPFALKTTALVLFTLMAIPVGFFSFIALTFGNFVQDTVIQSAKSPDGAHYAELIDSDEGALGGDTFVYMYETDVNALIFTISKKPQIVYHGKWGEFENMKIYWEDDKLVIE